jgi:Ca2+-binding EF-hand superfamily protein
MATDSLISKLKPAEVQEIVTAFKEFDGNDNGFITPQEMKECLRKSKIPFEDADVEEVIKSMDNDHDGTVSYEEYMDFMAYAFSGQIKKYTPKTSAGFKKRTTKK